MRPDFDHLPAIHHHQAIGFAQRRQAVRNRDRRASQHQVIECLLDFSLGFGVDRRSRLIEDQDTRVNQQRAGDRNALAFAA